MQTHRNRIRDLTGSLASTSTRMSSWSERIAAQPSGMLVAIAERRSASERGLFFLIIHRNLSAGLEMGLNRDLNLALLVILGVEMERRT